MTLFAFGMHPDPDPVCVGMSPDPNPVCVWDES